MLWVAIPVVSTVVGQLKHSRDPNRIAKGTFCMRPAFKLRKTKANISVVAGMLIEFAQHSYYCLPNYFLEAHPRVTEVVELSFNTHVTYTTLFWTVVTLAVWNSAVLLMRVGFKGGRAAQLSASNFVWTTVYFISGPLYVSIIQHLSRVFDCDFRSVHAHAPTVRLNLQPN